VIQDDDAEKLKAIGIETGPASLSDGEIDQLVADRQAARQRRDFAASDRIREELADHGIILEDTKDGSVRWKRK
jgi:cysteinyl-tRNA synthetase